MINYFGCLHFCVPSTRHLKRDWYTENDHFQQPLKTGCWKLDTQKSWVIFENLGHGDLCLCCSFNHKRWFIKITKTHAFWFCMFLFQPWQTTLTGNLLHLAMNFAATSLQSTILITRIPLPPHNTCVIASVSLYRMVHKANKNMIFPPVVLVNQKMSVLWIWASRFQV